MVVFAALLLVAIGFLVWPHSTNAALLRLKIVRQTVEEGKPVVFFRVEVAHSRRIQIRDVERVTPNKTDSPYEELGITYSRPTPTPELAFGAFSNTASLGLMKPSKAFWAPSQASPLLDPSKGRREFGVLVPTKAAVWRLRVKVEIEDRRSWVRFKRSLVVWRWLRNRGISAYDATGMCWRALQLMEPQVVESELITNSSGSWQHIE
jgi:hypothetical protein